MQVSMDVWYLLKYTKVENQKVQVLMLLVIGDSRNSKPKFKLTSNEVSSFIPPKWQEELTYKLH